MDVQDASANQGLAHRAGAMPRWKRTLDLLLLLISLPASVVLSLAVSLLIKCGSPGPVLFRQRRVGFRGQQFICYKFRTMKVDADSGAHQNHTEHLMKGQMPMTKLDNQGDPRLIPFGAILRACGLDELPQLINILKGEMSIVGPRPCIPYEYQRYEAWQRRRFDAVPGLTGLWQVSGKNQTTFNEMIALDIDYSARVSLGLDINIILRTLPALWRQWRELRGHKRPPELRTTGHINKTIELHYL